jgi:hypothetical protein
VIVVLSDEPHESLNAVLGEEKGFVVDVAGRRVEIGPAVYLVDVDEGVARERLLAAAEWFVPRRGELRRGIEEPLEAPPPFPGLRPNRLRGIEIPPRAPAPQPAEAVVLRRRLAEAARNGVLPAAVPPGPFLGAERAGAPSALLVFDYDRLLSLVFGVVVGAVVAAAAAAAAAKWLLGWFVQPEREIDPGSIVECTVFAPSTAAPGASIFVQAFVHLPEDADDARAIATEFDVDAKRRAFQSLWSPVTPGNRLDFELRMPGLEIDEPTASLVWRSRTESVQFGVRIPPETSPGTVTGTLSILLESVPVGHVKFKLAIQPGAASTPSEPQGDDAHRYTYAFVSYATHDRAEVLRRVQMLRLQGIGYFQDVLSLEPGDRWAKRIEAGIDRCDLFLLFWSEYAKSSEWVRREVDHALARKGGDDLRAPEIYPVPIELPPVPPWTDLSHLHFNDPLLYFIVPRDGG